MRNPLLAVCLLILSAVTVAADEPDKALHTDCIYPTVRISFNGKGYGTGVVVRSEKIGSEYRNIVLTCDHVADDDTEYSVDVANYKDWSTFDNWQTYPAKRYCGHPERDLAIIVFVSPRPMATARFGFGEKLFIGTKLTNLGCGLGDEPRLDFGVITSLRGKVSGSKYPAIRTNLKLVGGDSGGPVFHDGKLVGFNQAVRNVNYRGLPQMLPYISFVIPVEHVKLWGDDEKKCLDFVYNSTQSLPALPYDMLRLRQLEIVKKK